MADLVDAERVLVVDGRGLEIALEAVEVGV